MTYCDMLANMDVSEGIKEWEEKPNLNKCTLAISELQVKHHVNPSLAVIAHIVEKTAKKAS